VKERDPLWLAVGAEGNGLQYQWSRNGEAIPGAMRDRYAIRDPPSYDTPEPTRLRFETWRELFPGRSRITPVDVAPNKYSGMVKMESPVFFRPKDVPSNVSSDIVAVSAGRYSAALSSSGELIAWNSLGTGPHRS
jgi:hypothetical protein